MKLRNIYFTLVPAWLALALERRGASLELVTNFEKLENTLSLDDVCYYINYLRKATTYVGTHFNDMDSIALTDDNQKWLAANESRIQNAYSQMSRFYLDDVSLIGQQVPSVVRKTNYVARSLPGQTCLAIVGCETSEPLNSAQLADDAVSELAKLLTFDEIKSLDVFRAFSQTAA